MDFQATKHVGGKISPEIIILHDTAGRLDKFNSMQYMKSNANSASAHLCVERDDTLTQLAPFNRRTNHAGKSNYHGRKGCNNFAIGIEIVNPGRLKRVSANTSKAWFGRSFEHDAFDIAECSSPAHTKGLWMPHTEAQTDIVIKICQALVGKYASIVDIVGHWFVSPGRKEDPQPFCDVRAIRDFVLDGKPIHDPSGINGETGNDFVRVHVGEGSALNMREWPSFNPNVLKIIPHGTIVPVVKSGSFDGRDWIKVGYGGRTGWVVKSMTRPA